MHAPECLQFALQIAQIFNAVGTVVVGMAVVYIACMQHRIEKNKHKADLFEKRYVLYDFYMRAVCLIESGEKDKIGNEFRNMLVENKQKALFLVGREAEQIGEDLYDAWSIISTAGDSDDEKSKVRRQQRRLGKIVNEDLPRVFAPYLKFS